MKTFRLLLMLSLLSPFYCLLSQQHSSEQKIEKVLGQMTLEEKIDFIGGYKDYNIRPVEQSGIPMVRMADGPVGVRNNKPSTAFPASILLAASWDTAMAGKVGNAIAQEAKAKNINVMLCPGMNIHRAPMCGRNFEYLGEDPYLAGKIAASYIKGLQKEGVIATAKHYMANNQEYDRNNISSDMDERTLREIYLPAFKTSVVEGKVAAVMTSYNLINGIYASQNDLLINKILKDEWGFEGIVMTDWTSTYNGVAAAKAGLDLEMPSGIHMCKDTLLPAIRNGSISNGIIDDKVRRILRTYQRFNLFENPDISKDYIPDSIGVRQTAIDAARGGIVLLKNDNNFLPLKKSSIKSVAIIGPNAYPAVTGGGGSSYIDPLHPLSLFEALKQLAGNEVKITYETGNYEREQLTSEFFDRSDLYTYADGKKVPGINVDYYLKWWMENTPVYSDVFTNINHVFDDTIPGIPRDEFLAKFTGYLKTDKDGLYNFVVSSDGGYRLKIDDKDILGTWRNPGETARTAIVPLEAGKEYKITLMYFQHHRKTGVIRMNFESPESYEQHMAQTLKKVIQSVIQSDLTILSVGFNKDMEHEGADRNFSLPYEQIRLIHEVVKTNKDFIVVLNAGGNVDMSNWLDKSKALIHAWYPGQEGSLATAEIIFGVTNPSGKLPVSFEKRWEDNATFNSYYDTDGDKHVRYSEGIFIGYRHFDKKNIEPQFPFGFGLSYTTFEYSDLTVNKKSFSENEPIEVSLMIKNTGKYNGAEIVQLYISDPISSLPRPVRELKAFYKVWLNAGESKQVNFTLNKDAFQYFNPEMKKWIEEPGDFDILIGSSSRDIRLSQTIRVTNEIP